MIQGLEKHEIGLLIHCLKSSPDHVDKPMLLPLFLAELKTHLIAVLLEGRALSLEAIEYETGMSHASRKIRNAILSWTQAGMEASSTGLRSLDSEAHWPYRHSSFL